MNKIVYRNSANLIVVFRVVLIFVIIFLFSLEASFWKVLGLVLLVAAALLDGLDGYVARRFGVASRLGGLLDTLGDRITENLLLIYFAYVRLIPLAVPLIFVARSFVADFIRAVGFEHQETTFSMHRSWAGRVFVASRASRVIYLVFKMAIFFLGGTLLALGDFEGSEKLHTVLFQGSMVLVLMNLLRFFLLIYDSRAFLRKAFIE